MRLAGWNTAAPTLRWRLGLLAFETLAGLPRRWLGAEDLVF